MKRLIITLFIAFLGCKNNQHDNELSTKAINKVVTAQRQPQKNDNRIKSNTINSSIVVDSSLQIGDNTFYYRLLLKSDGKKKELYRIKNQDHSIDISNGYSYNYNGIAYECYQIADLPTGVTWSVIYDKIGGKAYITEPYDKEALGDSLKNESVDFSKKKAEIVSEVNKNTYGVKLIALNSQR